MAYPFQITTGRVILRIVISSAHWGIIHNKNTRDCKSPVPSIFGNLFNLLSVVLCLYCFLQSGKTHILFTLFLLVILNSDPRRTISCTEIEKQRDRRGPLGLSGKWVEKWKTRILILCHIKTVLLTFQKLHSTWNFYSLILLFFRASIKSIKVGMLWVWTLPTWFLHLGFSKLIFSWSYCYMLLLSPTLLEINVVVLPMSLTRKSTDLVTAWQQQTEVHRMALNWKQDWVFGVPLMKIFH